ncbi:vWA domain-containing protein [Pontibacter sp. 13R65]|uniref:vWA domain-containing protein n=1 Tax=Pontibacter sp. 13R65 TaxID=3127458 RepID=UPI00301C8880
MTHWRSIIALFCLLLLMAAARPCIAQEPKQKQPVTRILFLLDASGSMLAKWEGSDRMEVAKKLLAGLTDSLQQYQNLEVALRVYGHQFGRERNECKDTRLEVPFAANNKEAIQKKLAQIVPRGNTPITYSLEQSANDFPDEKGARNVVILITDGLESCKGDPCATSLALQRKRIFLRPFVIGIGIEAEQVQQLNCIGQYFNAADVRTFQNVLTEIVLQTLSPTTVTVDLVDEAGRPTESNVNMTFVNALTGVPEYNFVHYKDAAGKSDKLDIDALLPYDLVVHTTPPVVARSLHIKPGRHNVFPVKAPQGELYLRQDGPSPYGQLAAVVNLAGSESTLHVQYFGSRHKYLVGKYDLELHTLPRIYMKEVEIKQGQPTTISIPAPGQLNIPTDLQGYGSIYSISDDGSQQWIHNLPEQSSKTTLALQPGNYKLVYRMKSAHASKYTDVKDFTIRSGATTTVKIFNR